MKVLGAADSNQAGSDRMNEGSEHAARGLLRRAAGSCALLLLAACGTVRIGSYDDESKVARPTDTEREASGGSAGSGGRPSGGASGTNGGSSGGTGSGGALGGDGGDASPGGAPGAGGTGGSGPSDDLLERAAVDGFFELPSAESFVLPSASFGDTSWRHTFEAPSGDWIEPEFDDSSFASGLGGFYFGNGMPGDVPRTPWPPDSAELWARASFTVPSEEDIPKLMLWGRWDDEIEIYLNGELAIVEKGWSRGYRYLGLSEAARAALRPGENSIAVHVRDGGGAKYFDVGILREERLTARPRSGFERTAALGAYTDRVERFMVEHGIPAGVLAVMKRDTVVVSRGLGWSDKAMTTPLAEDAVMRIPVLDSIITQAAVRTWLAANGSFDEDTLVFPLLAERGLTPPPGRVPDERSGAITVLHLLLEQDGLPALPSPPELYRDLQIKARTTTIEDSVRWLYGSTLLHAPGECPEPDGCGASSAAVSRYLIDALEGDFLTYLRDVVLEPLGTRDVFVAHERLADRSPREPGYFTLESPYDRWIYLEGQKALAASAPAVVRFARGYHSVFRTPLIDPLTGTWNESGGGSFEYGGGDDGSTCMLVQRLSDQVSVAVIFNIGGQYAALIPELHQVTDGLAESDWGL